MLGALSRFQSDEQLVEQLQKIREEAENLKNRTNEAFSREFGDFASSGDPELDAILKIISND
jgi:DNA anti-recombination protein RmuC